MIAALSNQHQEVAHAPKIERRQWVELTVLFVVVMVAGWVFFAKLGSFPLFNPDEGLYAEPAREMLETGQYITTLLNYVVRFTKPPLCIWSMALSYQVFGVNEFAARFMGASSGVVLVAVVHAFLTRFAGLRAALLGSITLLTAPLFVATGRIAITDMPLSLCMAGCLLCFYRAFRGKERFWSWTGYVLMGLAVMIKGPVGVVLPVMILCCYHLLAGDWREALLFYRPRSGALIVAAISLPWFILESWITRGAYFQEFIIRENFQRFTGVVDHPQPWWYHLAAMLGGFFPGSVYLPQAVFRALTPSSGRWAWLPRFRRLSAREDLSLFAVSWAAVTLGFFSLGVSKLIPYTLPAFPALAILVGLELSYRLAPSEIHRRGLFPGLLIPALMLATAYGAVSILGSSTLIRLRDCPPDLIGLVVSYANLELAVIIVSILLLLARRPRAAIGTAFILTLVTSATSGLSVLKVVSAAWEGPLPGYARFAALSGQPILVYDARKPGIPFYAGRRVWLPASKAALLTRLKRCQGAYIITRSRNRECFSKLSGCRITAQEGLWMLVSYRAPVPPISRRDGASDKPL